jgi:capsular polysaccharide biosynthesis protein
MIVQRIVHTDRVNHSCYVDISKWFSNTIAGKFYLRHLRQYAFIRNAAMWSWMRLIAFKFLITAFKQLTVIDYNRSLVYPKPFKLLTFKRLTVIDHNGLLVYPKQKVSLGKPSIYPNEKSSNIKVSASCEFPEVFVATIADAMVIGSSKFVHTDQAIIGHNIFRISHDYTSEEFHGHLNINVKKQLMTRLSSVKADIEIAKGALFTDALSSNYAHFMTEALPRIFAYTQTNPDKTIPLIIDCELHANLMQALEMVVAEDAQCVGLEEGALLQVKSLHVVSACGYIPFKRRPGTSHFTDHSHGLFSPSALLGIRDLIKSKIANLQPNTEVVAIHKKIWIKRNSTYRNVSNVNEIEAALIARGFAVIEPEKLSFSEQVSIFGNADIVVGATGAALANLIFCKPETKIIILIADFKHMIYGYWHNMAASAGNQVSYVLGAAVGGISNIHSDFRIEITDLLEAISD